MKKLLLIVLLALNVFGGEVMCDDAYERFLKYNEQFAFAYERKDLIASYVASGQRVFYIEKTITSCGRDWKHREQALIVRKSIVDVHNTISDYINSKR